MEDRKNYYDLQFDDIYEGIIFKPEKLNPVEYINLVTMHTAQINADSDKQQEFINKCMRHILWTKDGNVWNPLLNSNGTSRLPELDSHPEIGFDLFLTYVREVISPVFTASKTYRNLTSE